MIYLYIYTCVYKVNLHPFLSLPAIDQVWPHRVQHIVCYKWTGGDTNIILISNINTMWGASLGLRLFLCVCGQKLVKNSQVGWKIIQKKLSRPVRMWLWIFWMLQMNRLSRYKNTMLWLLEHLWCRAWKIARSACNANFLAHSVKTTFFAMKSNNYVKLLECVLSLNQAISLAHSGSLWLREPVKNYLADFFR